jgi:hypothetical protein
LTSLVWPTIHTTVPLRPSVDRVTIRPRRRLERIEDGEP